MLTEYRYAELRLADDGAIDGVVVRYGSEASVMDFRERIEPGAFAFDDVILNLHHDRTRPIARTDGGGLTLSDTKDALTARAVPVGPDAKGALELVQKRVLRGFSVEMAVQSDRFEHGVRVIDRAKLVGIGLVDRPAYSDSQAQIAKRFAIDCKPGRVWWL